MKLAEKWVQPTRFSGEYPDGFAGYTWLQWDNIYNVFHPGDDYNFGVSGNDDLGQDAKAISSGIVVYTGKSTTGYGNMIVIKHQLGYNLKRFIQQTYGIETDELYSLYAHLQEIQVAVGNEIDCDALIGKVGNSGTEWAHLHCELYTPNKDLKDTDWRYYPVGWTKEKVQANYLPPYLFIEATKQLDNFLDTFMGKSKDYWIQVEKDRISLLEQLGTKDKEWALKLEIQAKECEKQIGELKEAVLKAENEQIRLTEQAKLDAEKFAKKELDYKKEIDKLKSDVSRILSDNAENYKFMEALKLVIKTIKLW